MTAPCEALSQLGVWVRLHYVYPYPNVDEVIPLMAGRQDSRLISTSHSSTQVRRFYAL